MKFVIIILIIQHAVNLTVTYDINDDNHDWNYIYSYAIILNTHEIASRIADVTLQNCHEKNIVPEVFARLLWTESKYRQHATSYINGERLAYGISQVNLYQHAEKLYFVYDKKYAKRLHEQLDFMYKMIYFIGVNITIGTDILRDQITWFDGDYRLALTAYWSGANSKYTKRLRDDDICNKYINAILNKEQYEHDMALYNGWKYIEYKPVVKNKYIGY